MWVPPEYRSYLQLPPRFITIASARVSVDMSRFVHGTDWVKCCSIFFFECVFGYVCVYDRVDGGESVGRAEDEMEGMRIGHEPGKGGRAVENRVGREENAVDRKEEGVVMGAGGVCRGSKDTNGRGRNVRNVGIRTAATHCGRWNGGEYGQGGQRALHRPNWMSRAAKAGGISAVAELRHVLMRSRLGGVDEGGIVVARRPLVSGLWTPLNLLFAASAVAGALNDEVSPARTIALGPVNAAPGEAAPQPVLITLPLAAPDAASPLHVVPTRLRARGTPYGIHCAPPPLPSLSRRGRPRASRSRGLFVCLQLGAGSHAYSHHTVEGAAYSPPFSSSAYDYTRNGHEMLGSDRRARRDEEVEIEEDAADDEEQQERTPIGLRSSPIANKASFSRPPMSPSSLVPIPSTSSPTFSHLLCDTHSSPAPIRPLALTDPSTRAEHPTSLRSHNATALGHLSPATGRSSSPPHSPPLPHRPVNLLRRAPPPPYPRMRRRRARAGAREASSALRAQGLDIDSPPRVGGEEPRGGVFRPARESTSGREARPRSAAM
ncbi:hypothetical protein FB451DRAFT_1170001 [Mycena latifolia]|nr:hypothetical protein FB451DRAFT_1170001 [Mycena latifolia]